MGNLVEVFAEVAEYLLAEILDEILLPLGVLMGFSPGFLVIRLLLLLVDNLATKIEDYILYFAYRDFVFHRNGEAKPVDGVAVDQGDGFEVHDLE